MVPKSSPCPSMVETLFSKIPSASFKCHYRLSLKPLDWRNRRRGSFSISSTYPKTKSMWGGYLSEITTTLTACFPNVKQSSKSGIQNVWLILSTSLTSKENSLSTVGWTSNCYKMDARCSAKSLRRSVVLTQWKSVWPSPRPAISTIEWTVCNLVRWLRN